MIQNKILHIIFLRDLTIQIFLINVRGFGNETTVYISKATEPFTSDSLKELTEIASNNNKKLNVTGCMLYASGYFLQLLEGNSKSVDTLYHKIEKDSRHKGTKVLI